MKRFISSLMLFILLFTFTACSGANTTAIAGENITQNSSFVGGEATEAALETGTGIISTAATTAPAEKSQVHEDAQDYLWDNTTVIPITLNGSAIIANDAGVKVDGSAATIQSAGTYSLSGSLADGQIIVDTDDKDIVRLILNGVELNSTTSAPIYIASAEKTVIVLAEGTENSVTDATSYVLADPESGEPNAAIFSKSDLTIYGSGILNVNGNYNDGVTSKDGLIIASGTLTVNAADDGIVGKDYLVVKGGNLAVNAQGDGLKSDNEEDATRGYVTIEAGTIQVEAGADAIQAQTNVLINQGELTLSSVEDAINANGSLAINGGTFQITSGDDGLHADAALEINGGDIQIVKSYEGLESAVITINAGTIHVAASDDGINVAGGNDGSGMNAGMGAMRPGAAPAGEASQDTFTYSGDYYLYIHGGYVVVNAAGDGVDVNGAIEMTDGVVLVNGPTEPMNGALDYDGTFNITGGFFLAAGSSGMAMAPGQSSSQSSALIYLNAAQPAGTLIHIQNSAGENLLTFAPAKEYQSILISSPKLADGAAYEIYTGGSATGSSEDGWYQDGAYTPGASVASFTVSNIVTTVGSGGNSFRRP